MCVRIGLGWVSEFDDGGGYFERIDESFAGSWEEVAGDGCEGLFGIEVEEVGDLDHIAFERDQVQGIFLTFTSTPASRGRGTALDDDHPVFGVFSAEDVQRVANVSSVQVTSQDQIDLEIDKPVDRPSRVGERLIAEVIGCGREMVVCHHDAESFRRRVCQGLAAEIQLWRSDSAVGNRTVGCGGIQADENSLFHFQHRIQFVVDILPVQLVGCEQTFDNAVEGHIVVSGHYDAGYGRQSLEEVPCGLKLRRFCSLGQVTARDDHVGFQFGSELQEGRSRAGQVMASEVQVGDMQDAEHRREIVREKGGRWPFTGSVAERRVPRDILREGYRICHGSHGGNERTWRGVAFPSSGRHNRRFAVFTP